MHLNGSTSLLQIIATIFILSLAKCDDFNDYNPDYVSGYEEMDLDSMIFHNGPNNMAGNYGYEYNDDDYNFYRHGGGGRHNHIPIDDGHK